MLLAIISTVAVLCIAWLWLLASGKSRITKTTWKETLDYSITEHDSGKTYAIEFGFSDDGTLHWKKGREKQP